MGITKRRLYKPERRPARKKGVLEKHAPIALPGANKYEIATALWALCKEAGVIVGQGGEYDALKDQYTVIGKSMATGKAMDFKVQGQEVAIVISIGRQLNGGPMKPDPTKRSQRLVSLQ
jgi:hypothetical protein